jgi:hypothetical protein
MQLEVGLPLAGRPFSNAQCGNGGERQPCYDGVKVKRGKMCPWDYIGWVFFLSGLAEAECGVCREGVSLVPNLDV